MVGVQKTGMLLRQKVRGSTRVQVSRAVDAPAGTAAVNRRTAPQSRQQVRAQHNGRERRQEKARRTALVVPAASPDVLAEGRRKPSANACEGQRTPRITRMSCAIGMAVTHCPVQVQCQRVACQNSGWNKKQQRPAGAAIRWFRPARPPAVREVVNMDTMRDRAYERGSSAANTVLYRPRNIQRTPRFFQPRQSVLNAA